VVGVVNAFAGAGSLRSQGGSGGGGGGGGGGGQGASNPLNAGQAGQGGGGGATGQNQGGLNFITQVTLSQQVSAAARAFFTSLGVNLVAPAGKAVFFNDRTGILLVKATEQDLDTIDKAIQALDVVAPQVHIKARFIEVLQTDSKQMGFDWYLGQFQLGDKVVGQGGNPGSLNVPSSPANPGGTFPGATPAQLIADGGQQLFSSGLSSATAGATTATITGILTNPNFQVVLHLLDQRAGTETLAEPEIVTTSGRQTQVRATQVITVITGVSFQQGTAATTSTGTGTTP
jgi:general secretion pathway protein D